MTKIDELLSEIEVGRETVFDLVSELSDDGSEAKRLIIERRHVLPQEPRPRVREESRPRAHTVHTADSLCVYLKAYKTANTVVLVDAAAETVTAVIDETSTHGREAIVLKPQVHPLVAPWLGIFGKPMELMAFVQFCMERRSTIKEVPPPGQELSRIPGTPPIEGSMSGRQLALLLSEVTAAKSVKISRGKTINGVVVETHIGTTKKETPVELPEQLLLELLLYVGDAVPRRMVVDLLIYEARDEIYVRASCGDVEAARCDSFQAMIDIIDADLEGVVCVMGAPAYGNWNYLPELDCDEDD